MVRRPATTKFNPNCGRELRLAAPKTRDFHNSTGGRFEMSPLRKYRHFLLVVGPICVVILASTLFDLNAHRDFSKIIAAEVEKAASGGSQLTAARQFNESAAHFFWLTTILLETVIGVSTCIFAGFVIYKLWGMPRTKQLACLVVGTVLASTVQAIARGRFPPWIFSFTHDALDVSHIGHDENFLPCVSGLQTAANIIWACANLLGLFGVSIMLSKPEDQNDLAGFYVVRLKYLTLAMYLVSVYLATGVLQMSAWMQWPLSLMSGGDTAESVKAVSLAASSYWGIAYSLIVVATFLPAAIILYNRLRGVLEADADVDDPQAWLKERRLILSPAQYVGHIAVVLGPAIAAPFGKLLGGLEF